MPMASWIAWLNSCTPLQAMRAPLGCGLQTRALPAASMLMALQASVGSECVTGVMTPMTPNGAYSCRAMPFSPLKASVRRNSTPGMRSAMTFSFSILWSSRPIFVSSSSSRPSVSACSVQICGCSRRPCGGRPGRGARTRAGRRRRRRRRRPTSSKTPQRRGAGRCRRRGLAWPLRMCASTCCTTLRISSSVTCMVMLTVPHAAQLRLQARR